MEIQSFKISSHLIMCKKRLSHCISTEETKSLENIGEHWTIKLVMAIDTESLPAHGSNQQKGCTFFSETNIWLPQHDFWIWKASDMSKVEFLSKIHWLLAQPVRMPPTCKKPGKGGKSVFMCA